MTLIDLINQVGLANVTLQPLERDLHEICQSKKLGCTVITFGTKAISAADIATDNPTRKVGFVLWFPKDRIPVNGQSVGRGNEKQGAAPLSESPVPSLSEPKKLEEEKQ